MVAPAQTWVASDGRRATVRATRQSACARTLTLSLRRRVVILSFFLSWCAVSEARITTTLHIDLEGDMYATDGLDCPLCTHGGASDASWTAGNASDAPAEPLEGVSWGSRLGLDMLAVTGATGWPIEIHAAIAATSAALSAAAAPAADDPHIPLLCLFVEAERDLLEAEERESARTTWPWVTSNPGNTAAAAAAAAAPSPLPVTCPFPHGRAPTICHLPPGKPNANIFTVTLALATRSHPTACALTIASHLRANM